MKGQEERGNTQPFDIPRRRSSGIQMAHSDKIPIGLVLIAQCIVRKFTKVATGWVGRWDTK
jgi:hypothetical protein